jgi:hypothetical protein
LLGGVPVHIIVVNVSLINNVKVFRELYMADYLDGVYVPHDRRVYVLDEIDCSGWRDLIRCRKKTAAVQKESNNDREAKKENGDDDRNKRSNKASRTKRKGSGGKNYFIDDDSDDGCGGTPKTLSSSDFPLMQGQILEVWDGVVKRPAGQVTFINTNFYEEIDDAILRPGRIDHVLQFDMLPKRDIADMYRQWFNGDIMPECVYTNMRDRAFTQADIGCIFSNQLDVVHRLLCEKKGATEPVAAAAPPSIRTAETGSRSHALKDDDILTYVSDDDGNTV